MTYSPFFNLTTGNNVALTLYEAARKNDGRMSVPINNGREQVDICDSLRAFAAGADHGTSEILGGVSNGGIIESFRRIGRSMARKVNIDWNTVKAGHLSAFGLSRAIWIPGYKDYDTIEFHPEALFNRVYEQQARKFYAESPHCRHTDFDFHLGQLRGNYLLYRLASYHKQQEWDTSVRYQKKWAKTFLEDPAAAEFALMSSFEQAGVFDLG